MIADVKIRETNNGGDIQLEGNDLGIDQGWENMVYLALFGGEWWGNELFNPENKEVWFNSRTEKRLYNEKLNSGGLQKIEDTILKDLEFVRQFATLEVDVELIGADRIRINISITEPETLENSVFQFIWDKMEARVFSTQSLSKNIGDFDPADFDPADWY